MKKLILPLLVLFVASSKARANPVTIPVLDYKPTQKSYVYEVISNKNIDEILLDCQSFLNGVTFYQKTHPKYPEPSYHFFLYSRECHSIHRFLISQMKRGEKACIKLYPQEKNFALYSNRDCR